MACHWSSWATEASPEPALETLLSLYPAPLNFIQGLHEGMFVILGNYKNYAAPVIH